MKAIMDIHSFWKDVLAQNAAALNGYFQPDAQICWHCTNERFSVAEFIRANCEYPGEWDGKTERLIANGDELITVTHVFSKTGHISCHVVSFIRLAHGKIAQLDEYWGDDGPAPEWRQAMNIGKAIK